MIMIVKTVIATTRESGDRAFTLDNLKKSLKDLEEPQEKSLDNLADQAYEVNRESCDIAYGVI